MAAQMTPCAREQKTGSPIGRPTDPCPVEAARTPFVIGITGASGSGKTTFAKRLAERLGQQAAALAHDDYYRHLPDMTVEEARVYDFDSPEALDTQLLVEHLHQLKSGQAVGAPSYNFAAHARTEASRWVQPAPIIVVEGLLVMADPALRDLFDLVVFIDVEPDVRALRRIERDCRDRGADLGRAVNMYLATTRAAYERYVAPYKASADIVVPDAENDLTVEIVAQGLLGLCGLEAAR